MTIEHLPDGLFESVRLVFLLLQLEIEALGAFLALPGVKSKSRKMFDFETKPEASFALSRDWRVFFLQSKRKENLTLVFFNLKSALAGFFHLII